MRNEIRTAGPHSGVAVVSVRDDAGKRENADADDAADADGCQLPQSEALKEAAVFAFFLNVVDRLAPHDRLGHISTAHQELLLGCDPITARE
jgi:hypothetical protein